MKRRKFIKGLLLAPAVVAVGPLLPADFSPNQISNLRNRALHLYKNAELNRAKVNSLMSIYINNNPMRREDETDNEYLERINTYLTADR